MTATKMFANNDTVLIAMRTFDKYIKKAKRNILYICMLETMLAVIAFFSINYGVRKGLGLIIPLIIVIFGIVIGSVVYIFILKRLKQLNKLYKERLELIQSDSDSDTCSLVREHYHDYDRHSIKPNPKILIAACLTIIVLLSSILLLYNNKKKFDPEKWKQGGIFRLVMAEDFLARQEPSSDGLTQEYYLRDMTEDEIDDMLYDPKQEEIIPDIDVTLNQRYLSTNIDSTINYEIKTYYVYTTNSGKNYWLILLCNNSSDGSHNLLSVELMSSGMKRVYFGGADYGDECRLWF
ncbi:MAG: hypothetical protein BWY46_00643 [Firmicutes bacterium ADurb.Bin300]|nr:MAG: hypothetical protein BWY46_00643 [Firmicutes bacterium ADurb.Bin300]